MMDEWQLFFVLSGGQAIPIERIGIRWEHPSHAQLVDGVGDRVRPGGIGLQGLFDKQGAGCIKGIAKVEEAGELRYGVFRSDDDQLTAGAGREQLEMG